MHILTQAMFLAGNGIRRIVDGSINVIARTMTSSIGSGVRRSIALSLMTVVLAGCEQVVTIDVPYREQLVINTFIGQDDTTRIQIQRTLPTGVQPTFENSVVLGGRVTLSWNGQTVALTEDPTAGMYILDAPILPDHVPISIDVQAGSLHASSTTTIPSPVDLISVEAIDTVRAPGIRGKRIVARLRLQPSTVAWMTMKSTARYIESMPTTPFLVDDNDLADTTGQQAGGIVELRSRSIYSTVSTSGPDSLDVSIWIAERPFLDFVESKEGGFNPFGFSGRNPKFNVTGDAIGAFFGVRKITKRVRIKD